MADRKTSLSTYEVLTLLSSQFPDQITGLNPLKEGWMSQAFSFESGGSGYVIRLCVEEEGFLKDKYAFEHFSSLEIPIPKVVKTGQVEGGYFSISEKLPGKDLRNADIKNNLGLLKDMFEVMNAIHRVELPKDAKFGFWDKNGKAKYESYKDFEFREEVSGPQPKDQELFDELREKVKESFRFIPKQKWLVHGDYGFDNLLAEEAKVTGVLDWSESFYGDFLRDVAWLNFWSDDVDFKELYKRYYKEAGIEIPDYDERLMFQELLIGRGSLGFALLLEDEEHYSEVKGRVLKLLDG